MSGLALIVKVVAAQNRAAPTIITSPMSCPGSVVGAGTPNAITMPMKDRLRPSHWGGLKPICRQDNPRAKHHKKRRKIYEQGGARSSGVEETLKDQDEFDGEQNACRQTEPQRAVTLEQSNATQSAPCRNQQRSDSRTHGGLRQRRDVVNRKFGRDLVKTPGQAQDDHDAGRKRVEWTRG